MKDTLKEYKDILLILEEKSKPAAKHNKLLKISLSTEDLKLRELLEPALYGYKRHITQGYWMDGRYPQNRKEWLEYMGPVKENLKGYCEACLVLQKPQWQIIAEQNGWGPIHKV